MAIGILLASCGGNGPKPSAKYPGYNEGEEGAIYAIHSLGESGRKPVEGDWLELKMIREVGDSIFYDSEFETPEGTMMIPYASSKYYGVLTEGDSATFLLPASDIAGAKDSMMHCSVKLVKIYSGAEHDTLEKHPRKTDPELGEQKLIQTFLRKKKLSATADGNGIYVISSTPGTGAAPAVGDSVWIRYTFTMFNGRVFGSRTQRDEGDMFFFGEQDQMLKGSELMLRKMKAGGKMRAIVPSALMFGKEGSSNNTIKPYTPLIVDVELVRVQTKKSS